MRAVFEWEDAVVAQAGGASPDEYVAVIDGDADGFVGALFAAEEEGGREA
jgi:hypothetical protein